jgi:hypothetical protein
MMTQFAILDQENKVIDIFVVDQADVDANGGDQSVQAENWVKTNLLKDENAIVKQFSNDGSFRANGAEPNGGYYDPTNNVFITIKPFSSWSLNAEYKWQAPVQRPDPYTDEAVPDYKFYPYWDEENQAWCAYNINEEKIVWNPNTSSWQ